MAEEEPIPATEAPFMEAAKGRVPLSTNAGSAKTWFPEEVPRPDREYDTLWWRSFFGFGSAIGITDFYLRSPLTGLLKLIPVILIILSASTAGAGIGSLIFPMILWGVWEFLHITFEKHRVVNYGVSAPFDLWHGIGQGMVTNKDTNYTQRNNFTAWQVTSIFSFLGIDGLASGKPGLFIRKCLDAAILGGCLYGMFHIITGGISRWWLIPVGLLTFLELFFVIYPYYITLKAALNTPKNLFVEGLKFEGRTVDLYNYYGLWAAGIFGPNTEKGMRYDIGVTSVSGEVLKKQYEIYYENPEMKAAAMAAKAASASAPSQRGASIAKYSSIVSVLMGSLPLAPFFVPAFLISTGYIPIEIGYAAAAVLRGDTPEIPTGILPGFDRVAGLETATEAMNFGEAAKTAFLPKNVARNVGAQFKRAQEEAAGRAAAIREAERAAEAARIAAAGGVPAPAAVAAVPWWRRLPGMRGGARAEPEPDTPLSTEAIALGATVAALIGGGAIKLAVDTLMPK